jgi:hypothetical protein
MRFNVCSSARAHDVHFTPKRYTWPTRGLTKWCFMDTENASIQDLNARLGVADALFIVTNGHPIPVLFEKTGHVGAA